MPKLKKKRKRIRQRRSCCPSGQFFKVHGRELEADPVSHSGQAADVGISHGMVFFGVGKYPFNCLFSSPVTVSALWRMPEVFGQLHPWFPNVPYDHFLAVFAFGALAAAWAVYANSWVAFVFPISVPVGGAVFQNLIARAKYTVIMFVVNIFVFPEKPVLCHGTLVWQ